MEPAPSPSFVDALHTDRPAPDRADKMGLYGWLVGRWDMDAVVYREDGTQAYRPRRNPFRLGARRPRHPGRMDTAGHLLRHDAAGLRPRHRCVAHPVERPDAAGLPAADRPRARQRHRAGGRRTTPAPRSAGASPTSRRIRSIGSASARPTAEQPGSCRPSSSPAAWRTNFPSAPPETVPVRPTNESSAACCWCGCGRAAAPAPGDRGCRS